MNTIETIKGNWSSGKNYDHYMGRWSSIVAARFLEWCEPKNKLHWLDVGCGTGCLSKVIFQTSNPASVCGLDQSHDFLNHATEQLQPFQLRTIIGNAMQLPFNQATFDIAVSGLCINFLANPAKGIAEMSRVLRTRGQVAIYVWDYPDEMDFVRLFWDAAKVIDPKSRRFDEGAKSSICHPKSLMQLFENAGLKRIQHTGIRILMNYPSFYHYWNPFFTGQGMLGKYLLSLSEIQQEQLKQEVKGLLGKSGQGVIQLKARAWCVKGFKE